MPRYLILNRFDDKFGEYHRFAEPGDDLAYITTPAGLAVLDQPGALDTMVVRDLDIGTVAPVAQTLAARHGPFDEIVGLSEYDLMTAARLRTEFGTPGWRPEFVAGFRDKFTMKQRVAAAGLRVPQFLALDAATTAADVATKLGLPVILKPRGGAASKGVVRAATLAELTTAMARIDPAEFECEEYIDGDIYHVDGIRRSGEFHFASASIYLNTCLDFALGAPLGSVLLDPGPRKAQLIGFAARCLDALSLVDGPFHLELFVDKAGNPVFCEVGLRPGGAEVPFLHLDLFGIDLFGEAYRATIGRRPLGHAAEPDPAARSGGFVIVPEPRPLPSRVTYRRSMLGSVRYLYAETVPDIGDVFDGTGGYEHIGGRFRFAGPDFASVQRSALEVMARYLVVADAEAAR